MEHGPDDDRSTAAGDPLHLGAVEVDGDEDHGHLAQAVGLPRRLQDLPAPAVRPTGDFGL
jgi:hypothetical protein